MKRLEVRYFPICHRCGERPWWVPARALDVRCDVCGRELDAFQPRMVRIEDAEAA